MSNDDDRAPLGPIRARMGLALHRLVDRGRAEIDRVGRAGLAQIERRQLQSELEYFWTRLGKTAYRLVEAGEIDHPGLRRAMAHIDRLEAQLGGAVEDAGAEDDRDG